MADKIMRPLALLAAVLLSGCASAPVHRCRPENPRFRDSITVQDSTVTVSLVPCREAGGQP